MQRHGNLIVHQLDADGLNGPFRGNDNWNKITVFAGLVEILKVKRVIGYLIIGILCVFGTSDFKFK